MKRLAKGTWYVWRVLQFVGLSYWCVEAHMDSPSAELLHS